MTTDEAAIEAMARAIWQAHEDRNPISFTKQTWEQGTWLARKHRVEDATAALAALREMEAGR